MPDKAVAPVFSRRISLDDGAAFHGQFKASAAECKHIASEFQIESLNSFSCTYRIEPLPLHRYRLTGTLNAEVTQSCIATLEPVEEAVNEAFSVEFWPAEQIAEEDLSDTEAGLDQDLPEAIQGGKIDVGAFVAEVLASAINPYPRKKGAEFVWQEGESQGEAAGPFADLAKLRAKT